MMLLFLPCTLAQEVANTSEPQNQSGVLEGGIIYENFI
jgi:hypothetical protein